MKDLYFPDMTSTLFIRSFHIHTVDPGWSYQSHYHSMFELLHCQDGRVKERIHTETIGFQDGDWLLIKPGVKHSTDNDSPSPFTYLSCCFDIDDPMLRKDLMLKAPRYIAKRQAEGTRIPDLFKELKSVIENCRIRDSETDTPAKISLSSTDKLALQACLQLIVREFISIGEEQIQEETGEWNPAATRYETDIAHQIEQWLNEAVFAGISIGQIAHKAGLSRGQCTKIFNKIYGMAPRQYMTSLRLSKAKELLVHSDLTIEAVSEKTGFSSLSHFSRLFKQWVGISPQQYRPKHSRDPEIPQPDPDLRLHSKSKSP